MLASVGRRDPKVKHPMAAVQRPSGARGGGRNLHWPDHSGRQLLLFVYLYVQAPGLVSRRRVQLTTAFRPEAAPSAADGGRGRQPQQHSTTEGGRVRSSGGQRSGRNTYKANYRSRRRGGGGFLHFFARNCFHFSGKRAPQRFSFC
jgi:hypothetical protein